MELVFTLSLISVVALGIYIYTFTPSGKRWTGEADDVQE
ncbi:hypothetical protein Barb6_00079 [Bacteroidales bacterium Barb6]|nr:hypothetical protein Barb4_00092 [Bacteroidales bacterium Barb4]OAV73585.1 hypothetical protein Barb6_00079 [Bacteroidales bacterium Barb6]